MLVATFPTLIICLPAATQQDWVCEAAEHCQVRSSVAAAACLVRGQVVAACSFQTVQASGGLFAHRCPSLGLLLFGVGESKDDISHVLYGVSICIEDDKGLAHLLAVAGYVVPGKVDRGQRDCSCIRIAPNNR